jgi:hypothetical protein
MYFILLGCFAAYTAAIMILYRIPASVSESFYHPKIGYLFTLWCVATGFGVCALMAEASQGRWYQFLSLFAGAGLTLTGVAPRFKTHDLKAHYIGAGGCALAATAWMCAAGYWFIPLPAAMLAGGAAWRFARHKTVFWVEMALFASMFLTLFLRMM